MRGNIRVSKGICSHFRTRTLLSMTLSCYIIPGGGGGEAYSGVLVTGMCD